MGIVNGKGNQNRIFNSGLHRSMELKRLVERLTHTADVYIHINAKVNIEPFQKK